MSAFDLTDAQKDKIAKTQGFVVYNPYVTVIPAYNLNAIQHYLLNNQDSIIKLENDLEENIGNTNTNLNTLNNLENEINNIKEKVNHLETCVVTYKGKVLNKNNWGLPSEENGPYTQKIEIEGIIESDTPIVWLDLEGQSSEDAQKILEDWPLIGRIIAGENSITAYCYEEIPETNIVIMIKVVRDTMLPKED